MTKLTNYYRIQYQSLEKMNSFNLYLLSHLPYEIYENNASDNKVKFREDEIATIKKLLKNFDFYNNDNLTGLDGFYGPVLLNLFSRELDLIKCNNHEVINIELKSSLPKNGKEGIKEQLEKNKFYLKKTFLEVHQFTYIADSNELLTLNESKELKNYDFRNLQKLINNLNINDNFDFYNKFKPSNFNTSPFDDLEEFARGNYKLTDNQNGIKKEIINDIENKEDYIALKGDAGTGKTILAFDLLKTLGKKSIYIYCFKENVKLTQISIVLKVSIFAIKNIGNIEDNLWKECELLIIDESQRIYSKDLKYILEKAKENNIPVIFIYDKKQMNSRKETSTNIPESIENHVKNPHALKKQLRSDPFLINFINHLFSLNKKDLSITNQLNLERITLYYSNSLEETKRILIYLSQKGYIFLNYPKEYHKSQKFSKYNKYFCPNGKEMHDCIGQDLPKVAVLIDDNFYIENNKIYSNRYEDNPNYILKKCLYQNLTRAQDYIAIIIENNIEVYNFINDILNNCIQT